MNPVILKSSQARLDLVAAADYLEQAAGLATAERFLDAVEQALAALAAMPLMGSPWESSHPRLSGIYSWPVHGFRKYLIFYRPLEGGIDALRILHSARDIDTILEDGPNPT
jgi:toxin ParE1/3/4